MTIPEDRLSKGDLTWSLLGHVEILQLPVYEKQEEWPIVNVSTVKDTL